MGCGCLECQEYEENKIDRTNKRERVVSHHIINVNTATMKASIGTVDKKIIGLNNDDSVANVELHTSKLN